MRVMGGAERRGDIHTFIAVTEEYGVVDNPFAGIFVQPAGGPAAVVGVLCGEGE